MNATLRFGSTGRLVTELQRGINRMPSMLPRLEEDGIYGAKTTNRVRELQRNNGLVPDGIAGPRTWSTVLTLLNAIKNSSVPLPKTDPRRWLALMIAQKHFGTVDFSRDEGGKPLQRGGRPKGLDFLISMFLETTGETLTADNFRKGDGGWTHLPWIGARGPGKNWCGVFCIYCYRMAGFNNVYWDLKSGRPVGVKPKRSKTTLQTYAASIRDGDMGWISTNSHHFLIEAVGGNAPYHRLTTIDGNTNFGRIVRKQSHKVGHDNFVYYPIT